MKVAILDVYSPRRKRTSKDTNGGYGTVNDYGHGFVPYILTWVKNKLSNWPALYSAYTAAVLSDNGYEVEFIKTGIDKLNPRGLSGFELVLLTSSIVCHESELKAIKLLKPHVPVGVLGSFASSVPEPYINAGAFVIAGEPEFFFLHYPEIELLNKANGAIHPSTETKSVGSERQNGIKIDLDLDNLPFPAWDIVLKNLKPKYHLTGRSKIFFPIFATRGCPYSCRHYCTYPLQQGSLIRLRSPERIVEEMIHLQERFGASLFLFRDPVFSLNRKHTVQFCEEVIKTGCKFKFIIETHLNNLDSELSHLLKRAGLVMVKVGIESNDEVSMKDVRRFTIEQDKQVHRIRTLEQLGIKVTCFYIFGLPEDDVEGCIRTIEYAKSINSYGAQFSVFTPYPGAPVYKEYEDQITASFFEEFTQYQLVFKHKNISSDQMRMIMSRAYSEYYTNPKWVKKVMRKFISNH